MTHRFLNIASTPRVKAAQEENGSRRVYARMEGGPLSHDRLGPAEAAFISERDSFYLATVSETGWPYVQHRGGAPGFLRVLSDRLLGLGDYRGNKQYISLGNVSGDDRVSLILMDYANRRRLKLFGRMRAVSLDDDNELASQFVSSEGEIIERAFIIAVEAFDWNCPKYITPRLTEAELVNAVAPLKQRLERLEEENAALRAAIKSQDPSA